MIYFYQNQFLHMYFSKIMQTFYDLLLEATLNGCIFTINLFSLINGVAFLLYHNRAHC